MGHWTMFDDFFKRNKDRKVESIADHGTENRTNIVGPDCSESGS